MAKYAEQESETPTQHSQPLPTATPSSQFPVDIQLTWNDMPDELQQLIKAWPTLPEHTRKAIVKLTETKQK